MVNAGEAAGITISHGVMAIDVTRERVLVSKVSEARWGGRGDGEPPCLVITTR